MNKRVLIIANTASMIKLFNMHNIHILKKLGYEVVVAANFSNPGTISEQVNEELKLELKRMHIPFENVKFPRGIGSLQKNYRIYRQLVSIVEKYSINTIHTHAPLSSVISRLVARKKKIDCIYTSHGFQFFPGGPIKNWLIYYPIEYWLSRYTKALITINSDYYQEAKRFPVKDVYYIPGVGSNTKHSLDIKEARKQEVRDKKRNELGISKNEFLILSVGELSRRKNHITIIRALGKLNDPTIKYVIAGIGPEKEHLKMEARKLGVSNQVKFLGFQTDTEKLYLAADLNAFISLREGLGMGGLEGCALGLYIIASHNTGVKDYVINNRMGILINNPLDVNEVANVISRVKNKHIVAEPDRECLLKFDQSNVDLLMKKIYQKELES